MSLSDDSGEDGLAETLAAALGEPVQGLRPVSGGDINQAACATLRSGRRVFVKTQRRAPLGFFELEADGLAWLAQVNAVRIPSVLAFGDACDRGPAFLALEWIEQGVPARDHDERLGQQLAALHRSGAPCFGYARDNFLATLPQDNGALADWPTLYGQKRLLPLARRAHAQGVLDRAALRRVERLAERLPALCGPAEPPARLHGDLWSGNAIVASDGAPVLIDPAVYGGHREVDLAMMRLFGGFGARCFAAYDEAFPLAEGHQQRVPLYQLYPLLAHVCLFGSSYVAGVLHALDATLLR